MESLQLSAKNRMKLFTLSILWVLISLDVKSQVLERETCTLSYCDFGTCVDLHNILRCDTLIDEMKLDSVFIAMILFEKSGIKKINIGKIDRNEITIGGSSVVTGTNFLELKDSSLAIRVINTNKVTVIVTPSGTYDLHSTGRYMIMQYQNKLIELYTPDDCLLIPTFLSFLDKYYYFPNNLRALIQKSFGNL